MFLTLPDDLISRLSEETLVRLRDVCHVLRTVCDAALDEHLKRLRIDHYLRSFGHRMPRHLQLRMLLRAQRRVAQRMQSDDCLWYAYATPRQYLSCSIGPTAHPRPQLGRPCLARATPWGGRCARGAATRSLVCAPHQIELSLGRYAF